MCRRPEGQSATRSFFVPAVSPAYCLPFTHHCNCMYERKSAHRSTDMKEAYAFGTLTEYFVCSCGNQRQKLCGEYRALCMKERQRKFECKQRKVGKLDVVRNVHTYTLIMIMTICLFRRPWYVYTYICACVMYMYVCIWCMYGMSNSVFLTCLSYALLCAYVAAPVIGACDWRVRGAEHLLVEPPCTLHSHAIGETKVQDRTSVVSEEVLTDTQQASACIFTHAWLLLLRQLPQVARTARRCFFQDSHEPQIFASELYAAYERYVRHRCPAV
jgi:hypothetical protein